jgi:hypothetical protein
MVPINIIHVTGSRHRHLMLSLLQLLRSQAEANPPCSARRRRSSQGPSVSGWWFWAPPFQASLQGGNMVSKSRSTQAVRHVRLCVSEPASLHSQYEQNDLLHTTWIAKSV